MLSIVILLAFLYTRIVEQGQITNYCEEIILFWKRLMRQWTKALYFQTWPLSHDLNIKRQEITYWIAASKIENYPGM
jgi:hypothetical protein